MAPRQYRAPTKGAARLLEGTALGNPLLNRSRRYALTCCSWFAKDFPRMLKAKSDHE